ncbi:unnamed protein product [Triticum turgidum subsp. durum]|uniref:EF-hand domain-containing protein n=1 Tax=Triticum turgidum subsp. durum TaxID=4567 RepID=A0A9R0RYG4_TRITD|nr:unnamed protein product [Triticum turgidum subsp. durum]
MGKMKMPALFRRRSSSKSRSASPPTTPPREEQQEESRQAIGSPARSAEEELRLAFKVFDADGSGDISAAELAHVLHGLGEKATVQQCRRMIEGVDKNGDGLISFDEFKVMMAAGFAAKMA